MAKKYLTSFDPEDVLRVVLLCNDQNCRAELSFAVRPKLKPRWDLHFEGLEDYRKDPNTTAADQ